jgi:hypothetical protein
MESRKPSTMYSFADEDRNYRTEIVKEISHISFPQLNTLSLWGNMIESFEELAFVQMPQI